MELQHSHSNTFPSFFFGVRESAEQSHTSSMEIDGNKQGVADLGNEVYNVRSAAITRRIASLVSHIVYLGFLIWNLSISL